VKDRTLPMVRVFLSVCPEHNATPPRKIRPPEG